MAHGSSRPQISCCCPRLMPLLNSLGTAAAVQGHGGVTGHLPAARTDMAAAMNDDTFGQMAGKSPSPAGTVIRAHASAGGTP